MDVRDAHSVSVSRLPPPINSSKNGAPVPHYFDGVPVIEYQKTTMPVAVISRYYDAVMRTTRRALTLDDMGGFTDAYLVLKAAAWGMGSDAAELRRNKMMTLDENAARSG